MIDDYEITNCYLCDNSEIEALIVQTVVCLPDEIQEFVIERCRFLSMGKSCYGMVLPSNIALNPLLQTSEGVQSAQNRGELQKLVKQQNWLVLLSEEIADMEIENAKSIVAHEIAHAYLKHDRTSPGCPDDCEIEACKLTKKWGFEGLGTDIEHCDYSPGTLLNKRS